MTKAMTIVVLLIILLVPEFGRAVYFMKKI